MLDKHYQKKNLKRILRDLENYCPDEYARALLRLVCVVDPIVMTEPEFTKQRLKAIGEVVYAPPLSITSDPVGECDMCHRKSWEATDDLCNMTQPSGEKCKGTFKQIS